MTDKLNYTVLNDLTEEDKGFTVYPTFILRDNSLSYGARVLYGILLSYCHDKAYCYPSQSMLSKNMGCTKTTLRKYIKELIKGSYLKVETTITTSGSRNTYHIIPFQYTHNYTSKLNNYTDNSAENSVTTCEENTSSLGGVGKKPCGGGDKKPCGGVGKKPCPEVYNNNNIINNNINNNTLFKNKGVFEKTHTLFNTTNHKIKYLEDKLDKLDKNKQRLKCAIYRIELAKLKDDWRDVTSRDIAYYFAHVMYKDKHGKSMEFDNYFPSHVSKLITHYNLDKKDTIDLMDCVLGGYEFTASVEYPYPTQSLFSQYWLIDKILKHVLEERQSAQAIKALQQQREAESKSVSETKEEDVLYF